MKYNYFFILLISIGFTPQAQLNYSFTNTKTASGTYVDIAATGTAIPMSILENGSSTIPQNIGFNFTFNGTVFTEVNDAPSLRIAKDDGGSNWLDLDGVGFTNNVGSITSNMFTSFSDFVLANSTGGLNVLPLRLLSFTAKKKNTKALLQWRTENEINTARFEVERSSDGINFITILKVQARNVSGLNNYSFIDDNPFKGINCYRLKQLDIDGKFTFNNIIKLLSTEYDKPLIIFPNPAITNIEVNFTGKEKTVVINIFDGQGKQVLQSSLQNQLLIKVNISYLVAGKYYIQLSDGVVTEKASFIKQ